MTPSIEDGVERRSHINFGDDVTTTSSDTACRSWRPVGIGVSILYLRHAHIYTRVTKSANCIHNECSLLWCVGIFVIYREFIHVKAINIFSSNAL